MLIHQVDNKHWERSVMDQRPVSGAERHVPDPPVEFVAHLQKKVAVLELI